MRRLAFLALFTLLAACGGGGSDPAINDPANPPDSNPGTPPAGGRIANWIAYTTGDGTYVVNRDGTRIVRLSTYPTTITRTLFGYDYDPVARRIDNLHRTALVYFDRDRFRRIDLTTTDDPAPVQVSSLTTTAEPCFSFSENEYIGLRLPGSNGNCSDADARPLIIAADMGATAAPYAGELVATVQDENAATIRVLAINASGQLVALDPDFGNETVLSTTSVPVSASSIGSHVNRAALHIGNTIGVYDAVSDSLLGPFQTLDINDAIGDRITDGAGNLYYFIGPALYRLDLTSPGTPALLASNAGPADILHHYNGKLYALVLNDASGNTDLRSIDTADGSVSILHSANGNILASCAWSGEVHVVQQIDPATQVGNVIRVDASGSSTLLANARCLGVTWPTRMDLATGLYFPYLAVGAMDYLTDPANPTLSDLRAYALPDAGTPTIIALASGAWTLANFYLGSDTEFIGTLETATGNAIVRFTYGDPDSLRFLEDTPDTVKRLIF